MQALGKRVPIEAERPGIIRDAHLFGHFGQQAVFTRLWNEGIYWPTMRRDIKESLRDCLPCLQFNIARHGYHPLQSVTSTLPWDHIAVDLVGPLPLSENKEEFLLVTTDVFTRFTLLNAIQSRAAPEVARVLWSHFCLLGLPRVLQSDNGTEFVNAVLKDLLRASGVDHRLLSAYHPRANGVVERVNGVVLNAIKKSLAGAHNTWPLYGAYIQLAFNT